MHAADLAARHPLVTVELDVLYVEDGTILTSAGTAAGIDACLHLVRRELGSEVAATIARRMVVPPQREGGQRQYVESPVPAGGCRHPAAGAGVGGGEPRARTCPWRRSPGGR